MFLRALMYVVEGTIGDMTRSCTAPCYSPHYREHLSRTCNGLPKGAWSLCPSEVRTAPFGTTKWVETVLLSINSRDDYNRRFGKTSRFWSNTCSNLNRRGPSGNKQHDEVLERSLSDALC